MDDSQNQPIAILIDRDVIGSRLTPKAREKAIKYAMKIWGKQRLTAGQAVQRGIEHVTAGILEVR